MDQVERQTLELQVKGAAELKALNDLLGTEKVSLYDVATATVEVNTKTYELAKGFDRVADESRQVGPGLSAVDHALEEVASSSTRAAAGIGKVNTALTTAKGSSAQFTQGISNAGYALQDFTSTTGDLGQKLNSITNNLPQIIAMMGVGGPLGAGVAALGVGAIVLYRNWDSLTGLFESRNPFPKVAGDIAGMKRELEHATKEMAALEEVGAGTAEKLARFNELRSITAKLEKDIADQVERQARFKKAMESEGQEQKDRASSFAEVNAGKGPEVLAKIKKAVETDLTWSVDDEERRSKKTVQDAGDAFFKGDMTSEQFEEIKASEEAMVAKMKGLLKETAENAARDLYDGLIRGTAEAKAKLDALEARVGTGGLAGGLDSHTPAAKKAKAAFWDDQLKEWDNEDKADKDAEKKAHDTHKQDLRISKWFDEDAEKANEDFDKTNVKGSKAVAKGIGEQFDAEKKGAKQRAGMVASETSLDEAAVVDALRMKQAGKSNDEIQASALVGFTKALRASMGGDAVSTSIELTKKLMESISGLTGSDANIDAALRAVIEANKKLSERVSSVEASTKSLVAFARGASDEQQRLAQNQRTYSKSYLGGIA